jgi:hypothetical protein
MAIKVKKKFVCIRPKTDEATNLFEYSMLGLQSCELLEAKGKQYHLKPIRANYSFWMNIENDQNWEIEK